MNMELQSLKGWLKAYFVYLIIAVVLSAVAIVSGSLLGRDVSWLLMDLARLGLYSFAAYSVTQVGRPWVRYMHIALNGLSAIFVLLFLVVFPVVQMGIILVPWFQLVSFLPQDLIYPLYQIISWINLPLLLALGIYWAVSARIRETYAQSPAPEDTAPPPDQIAPVEAPAEAEARTMTWAEEDAALRRGSRSAQSSPGSPKPSSTSDTQKGCLKGCLISLVLVLIGLAVLAFAFIRVLDEFLDKLGF